jgi:hypothetical protein
MGFVESVCQPSTLRMLICPEASSAQNNIAAVSADGRTVWVLIRRLNSSCKRSCLALWRGVCTENLNADVVMMKSAEYRV